MHMLLVLVGEREQYTKKEMILISSVVFGKLVRKDGNENRYQDDLRQTDKNYPRFMSSFVISGTIHQSRSE